MRNERLTGVARSLTLPSHSYYSLRSMRRHYTKPTLMLVPSLACARLRVVGLASLAGLASTLGLGSRLGTASSPVLGCLSLASPHSWLLVLASPHSCGWPARLVSARRLGTAASPAPGCLLVASPHSWHGPLACARLCVVGLATLLARPPRLHSAACSWPCLTRVIGQHPWSRLEGYLGTAALPALGCLPLASPLTPDTAASPALGCLCWPRLTRMVVQHA